MTSNSHADECLPYRGTARHGVTQTELIDFGQVPWIIRSSIRSDPDWTGPATGQETPPCHEPAGSMRGTDSRKEALRGRGTTALMHWAVFLFPAPDACDFRDFMRSMHRWTGQSTVLPTPSDPLIFPRP